jgi:hypothetical protein
MHSNKSVERENQASQYSVGEELSKDIEELKDAQEDTLYKQLQKLDRIF